MPDAAAVGVRFTSGIYQLVSAPSFLLLSQNCFCWSGLCIFGFPQVFVGYCQKYQWLRQLVSTSSASRWLSGFINLLLFCWGIMRHSSSLTVLIWDSVPKWDRKYPSASLSKCLLALAGSDNIFTVTSLQPLFKIPDLAVSNPPSDITFLSCWSASITVTVHCQSRQVTSHSYMPPTHASSAEPLLEISSISPGLRSGTCLFCLCVMARPRWPADYGWMLSDALHQCNTLLQLRGDMSLTIK